MQHRFETFTVMITNINRSIKKIKTEEMQELNLKSPHVSCLYYLYTQKSLTAKELCDLCEEDKANISRSTDFLENNGYIVCRCKMPKRYRSPMELTEKGRKIGEVIAGKVDRILDEASVGLDEQKRRTMYESLAIISANLQKICSEY